MDRNLGFDIVRVTEAAAVASSQWIGYGKKNEADGAATTAMREVFDSIPIQGTVVIGEGEKDEAPMLYIGEKLGKGDTKVDVAVDPLEGTNLVAKGMPNAIAVVALAEQGCLLHAPDIYMEKIVVGPQAAGRINIEAPLIENLHEVAKANQKSIDELEVVILDRDRHKTMIEEVRAAGARVKLISDGEVAVAVQTGLMKQGIDLLLGIGGAPEAVLSAVALTCLGGEIQGRLCPRDEAEYQRCRSMGIKNPNQVLYMNDLVSGDDAIFAATGVTDGELLKGVVYDHGRIKTESLVMRARSGTIRLVESTHSRSKFSIETSNPN